MRTATRLTAVLGCSIAAALPAPAAATPTIDVFKVSAGPIPGLAGTGRLGTGALIHGTVKISGTEYGGSPAPLTGVSFFAPAIRLHQQGFTTCSATTLELRGPEACPKHSAAGPVGNVMGTVTFGGERVPEHATVEPFFAPGGGMEIFVYGRSPALVEVIAHGRILPAAPPFGLQVVGEIPLIITLPGALDASFVEGTVGAGAGYRQGGRTISYLTLPRSCPHGGWPVKGTLTFLGGGQASASGRMPCPAA